MNIRWRGVSSLASHAGHFRALMYRGWMITEYLVFRGDQFPKKTAWPVLRSMFLRIQVKGLIAAPLGSQELVVFSLRGHTLESLGLCLLCKALNFD